MENKSFGQIVFEEHIRVVEKQNSKLDPCDMVIPIYQTWENLPEKYREIYESCGNKLIQYYEEFILDNFLNNVKPLEK